MQYRSWARFALEGVEGLVATAAVLLTWPVSSRWLRNWGASRDEIARDWPGDLLIRSPDKTYTRAIGVAAPAAAVWPWIPQFGLDRAGFYSYELLERLVGIPVKNVESIVESYQSLSEGDEVRLHPSAPAIHVALVEQGHYVCLGGVDQAAVAGESDPARSWSIYVEEQSATSSRLLLRTCIEPVRSRSMIRRVVAYAEEQVDFVMEQRMLRTIKRLAERTARPRAMGRQQEE